MEAYHLYILSDGHTPSAKMALIPFGSKQNQHGYISLNKLFEEHGNILHIGRGKNMDIHMHNINNMGTMVSRKHATLIKDRHTYYLHPISRSTNGTYVNEEKISNLIELQNDDIIGFGGPQFITMSGKNRPYVNPYVFQFSSFFQ